MKKKIKEWCGKYITCARVEIAVFVVFGIAHACIGNIDCALMCVCCALAWLNSAYLECKYMHAYNVGVKLGNLNDDVIDANKQIIERLEIEEAHHYLTFLQMRAYRNDVAFCKREKSCSEYISFLQYIEEAIAEADDKVRKMRKEYKDKYGEDCL